MLPQPVQAAVQVATLHPVHAKSQLQLLLIFAAIAGVEPVTAYSGLLVGTRDQA
jgi:hypothetical protein